MDHPVVSVSPSQDYTSKRFLDRPTVRYKFAGIFYPFVSSFDLRDLVGISSRAFGWKTTVPRLKLLRCVDYWTQSSNL